MGLFAIMFTILLRLEARISSVDTKIDSVASKLDTKIDSVASKLDTKIDSVATKLDTKIDSVAAELRQDIRDQTARIDMLNTAVNQVVKDVGELKGYMVVVSERLNIPKSA